MDGKAGRGCEPNVEEAKRMRSVDGNPVDGIYFAEFSRPCSEIIPGMQNKALPKVGRLRLVRCFPISRYPLESCRRKPPEGLRRELFRRPWWVRSG